MQTFKKSERLSNFYHKEKLFSEGKKLFVSPFGMTYLVLRADNHSKPSSCGFSEYNLSGNTKPNDFVYPCKTLISAPKRIFKKAVQRNRVRRLVKEAFRKNKNSLYSFLEENGITCLLSLAYSSNTTMPFAELEEKMAVSLKRLCGEISKLNKDNNC